MDLLNISMTSIRFSFIVYPFRLDAFLAVICFSNDVHLLLFLFSTWLLWAMGNIRFADIPFVESDNIKFINYRCQINDTLEFCMIGYTLITNSNANSRSSQMTTKKKKNCNISVMKCKGGRRKNALVS